MRRLTLVAILLLVTLLAGAAPARGEPAAPQQQPGRVWVRLRDGRRGELARRAGALGVGRVQAVVPALEAAIVGVPPGQEARAAAELAARPDVEYALTIPVARALVTPNDPSFALQWGLSRINAPQAWEVVTGSPEIVIAVIDTGADLTHPDLASQLWTNPGEIPGNGVDDDGNGCPDDVHGCRFYAAEVGGVLVPAQDGQVQDDHSLGHGTHVAGIAGAATGNGVGVAGVSWGARIMPVKVLGANGEGDADDVVRGMLYAADNGARIINLSLGTSEQWRPLQEAVALMEARGVLVVAAAGNSSGAGVAYPAACPEALAVAATDSGDQRASFSSYGPEVDVAAPGVGVLSTCRGGGYCMMGGTSMAAPHVAGLAALVWTRYPWLSTDEVRARIERTAADVNRATEPGWDERLGYGLIDAGRAVEERPCAVWLPWVSR